LLGVLIFGPLSLTCWLLIRDTPEQCGLKMDGDRPLLDTQKVNQDSILRRPFNRAEALRSPSFWIFNLSFGFQAFAMTAYTFHVIDIGRLAGASSGAILQLFVYASFFSVGSNLLAGWLSGFTRVKYLLAVENFFGLLFWVAVWLVPLNGFSGPALLVVGMGISGGIWANLMGVVLARFFGRDHLGAISGVVMATMVLSSAVGPYIFGLTRELSGTYDGAFIFSAVVVGGLLLASFFGDNPQRKLPSSPEA
jgi:MFS transporter, OFA family, oxalate/formate antiporter